MNTPLLGLVLYLVAILTVAFITSRWTKNLSDFVLGGRKLGKWVITLSERASGESAWLLVGLPGAVLAVGALEIWTAIGSVAGIVFSWWVIAYKLRKESARLNALTLPELFANRYGDVSNVIRLVSSLIIIFFFTFYVSAQFSAAGKVLNVTFGVTELTGMCFGAAIIIFYTVLGGFFAVALTDVIQAVIMVGTLVFIPIAGFIELGGWEAMSGSLANVDPNLTSITGGKTGIAALLVAIGGLSWSLGYMGQPHLLTRYMAMDTPENIKGGRPIAFSWSILAYFGAFTMGLVGLALYGQMFDDPEKIMPYMATNLLPAWLAGIFISGAIAAMMSTADSQLLVASSVFSQDLYRRIYKKGEASQKQLLSAARYLTLGVGAVAFALALSAKDLVYGLVSFAWSGLAASFGPALLLTLLWKKTTRQGVLAGMLTGAVSTIIWGKIDFLRALMTERVVSFALAFAAVLVVSLITQNKSIQTRDSQP